MISGLFVNGHQPVFQLFLHVTSVSVCTRFCHSTLAFILKDWHPRCKIICYIIKSPELEHDISKLNLEIRFFIKRNLVRQKGNGISKSDIANLSVNSCHHVAEEPNKTGSKHFVAVYGVVMLC
jgi:hypothetical protein